MPRAGRDAVLRLMRRHNWLSESELASATAAPLQVAPPTPSAAPGGLAPHFVEHVKREAATHRGAGRHRRNAGH